MSLVLDSSATLAWIYSDETTEAIRFLFDTIAEEGAFVPALWRLEVANSRPQSAAVASMPNSAGHLSRTLPSWKLQRILTRIPMPGARD